MKNATQVMIDGHFFYLNPGWDEASTNLSYSQVLVPFIKDDGITCYFLGPLRCLFVKLL
ncbi:hypothetical protein Fmac_027915 [Flemingia macrophylla]|uniref:Uncharacterized protein n=1 Tax=Flemingia macrophylla TaxID=520843 RepID=A0ABD1LJ70_9FABA